MVSDLLYRSLGFRAGQLVFSTLSFAFHYTLCLSLECLDHANNEKGYRTQVLFQEVDFSPSFRTCVPLPQNQPAIY
jgi:hypothetical protein